MPERAGRLDLSPKSLWRDHRARVIGTAIGALLFAALPLVPSATYAGRALDWTALVPPLLAVVSALVTRLLLPSLAAGIVTGAFLHFGWTDGIPSGLESYVWDNAVDTTHLYIVGFTIALLGMVQVASASGGTRGIVESIKRWIHSSRSTRIGTWAMGLLVFFDDYANCMLVGPTMRPLSDRWLVSREKLAYIVDSTAAPVSGVVIVSTWVGYEIGLLDDVTRDLGISTNGYSLLLAALPFRFYCIFSIAFVFLSAYLDRDFGPMLRAERRAFHEKKVLRDDARPSSAPDARGGATGDAVASSWESEPTAEPAWSNAAAPIVLVVFGTLFGLVVDGGGWIALQAQPTAIFSTSFWRASLGGSENNVAVLFGAATTGAFSAILLPLARRQIALGRALRAFAEGARTAGYAALILLSAWALAAVCKDLGTGPLLVAALGESVPPLWIPVATFVVAALVAFSTGTSWGTMAILIPTVLPVAHAAGGGPLTVLAIAAILDGAIFGDHCSPISDTTVMSSVATACDHLDHVTTQVPYALLVMAAALGAGYVLAGLGAPALVSYVVGGAGLCAVLLLFGRRASALVGRSEPAR